MGSNWIAPWVDWKKCRRFSILTDFLEFRLINITAGNQTSEMVRETRKLLDPPPYNLTTVKNMAYAIFTREFLQWALVDSEEGSALFNWSSYTRTPDEHFWGTLHVYPKAPGWSKSMSWRGVARAILWKSTEAEEKCRGKKDYVMFNRNRRTGSARHNR